MRCYTGTGLKVFRINYDGGEVEWLSAMNEQEARDIFTRSHETAVDVSIEVETRKGKELVAVLRAAGRINP